MTETSAELAEVSKDQENKSDAATMNFDVCYKGMRRLKDSLIMLKRNVMSITLQIVWKKTKSHVIVVLKKIKNIIASYQSKLNNVVKVLCYGSPNRFWSVLRQ